MRRPRINPYESNRPKTSTTPYQSLVEVACLEVFPICWQLSQHYVIHVARTTVMHVLTSAVTWMRESFGWSVLRATDCDSCACDDLVAAVHGDDYVHSTVCHNAVNMRGSRSAMKFSEILKSLIVKELENGAVLSCML
eukprot:720824-Amphidinium_carterae.1